LKSNIRFQRRQIIRTIILIVIFLFVVLLALGTMTVVVNHGRCLVRLTMMRVIHWSDVTALRRRLASLLALTRSILGFFKKPLAFLFLLTLLAIFDLVLTD
jgi:hypothetical protein